MRRALVCALVLAVVTASTVATAEIPEQLFADGFESGSSCRWDLTTPMCGMCTDWSTVALWRFDEGTGQTAADASGNGRHLTLGPTAAVESADPTWAQGRFGSALYIASSSEEYASGEGSNTFPTNQLTVEMWVRPTGGSSGNGHAQVFTAGFINCAVATRTLSNEVWVGIGNGTQWESMYASASPTDLDDGGWHYLATTFDGSTLSVYVDGALADSMAVSTTLASPSDYKVGGRPQNTFLDGWIDEVRLSSVARTQTEIRNTWIGASACP
jgi:hypothetical protein